MNAIGALGYLLVGALFALLALLLLVTWRGNRVGIYLILASVLSSVWGLLLAAQTAYSSVHPLLVTFIEVSRTSVWILFLVKLASQIGVSRQLRILSMFAAVGIVAGVVVLGWLGTRGVSGPINLGALLIPGGLIMSLLGLVLIEQLYRNSSVESRWSLKPLVLGIGGIFVYDLFLYSQSMLLSSIDATTWIARGLVNALFVPMIAIAASRNTDWQLRIFVSRHVVFYSTTLIAAGLYLLLMSFGGYLIVRYGGSWGGLARIVFFAGGVVVLMTLLFSNTLRSRLKVFLNKHFFHNKYDYREEWLRLVRTLAEFDSSESRDVAVRALAQIVESPGGAMWVRADIKSSFKLVARYQTEEDLPDFPADCPVIRFIEKEGWLVDLDEYGRNPERYGDLRIEGWLVDHPGAWLLIPLQSSGELLGIILLFEAPGPPRLNYEDRDLLKTVGSHIAVHLAQARSDNLLAEAQQFEAYNRLSAFLMHDLNNLIAQQSLIVANAEKHKRNPEFVDDAISTIAGSVDRMKRVMTQLKTGRSADPAKLTDMKFIVSAAVDRCSGGRPVPTLELNNVEARLAVNADEFVMVLTHLVRNAQDASGADGTVSVGLRETDGVVEVYVADDGTGMSAEFVRDRLFRPFDSTKGAQGMGIGAYQAREFARRIGGELLVNSQPGRGTVVSMRLPAARAIQQT